MSDFEKMQDRLYEETGKDWILRLSWILTEPVCPVFSISSDDGEMLVRGRFANGGFDEIEKEIVKACAEALEDRRGARGKR